MKLEFNASQDWPGSMKRLHQGSSRSAHITSSSHHQPQLLFVQTPKITLLQPSLQGNKVSAFPTQTPVQHSSPQCLPCKRDWQSSSCPTSIPLLCSLWEALYLTGHFGEQWQRVQWHGAAPPSLQDAQPSKASPCQVCRFLPNRWSVAWQVSRGTDEDWGLSRAGCFTSQALRWLFLTRLYFLEAFSTCLI